jgi:hypothetical protein
MGSCLSTPAAADVGSSAYAPNGSWPGAGSSHGLAAAKPGGAERGAAPPAAGAAEQQQPPAAQQHARWASSWAGLGPQELYAVQQTLIKVWRVKGGREPAV